MKAASLPKMLTTINLIHPSQSITKNLLHYYQCTMTLRILELCLSFSPHPNISNGKFNLVHHFIRVQISQINEGERESKVNQIFGRLQHPKNEVRYLENIFSDFISSEPKTSKQSGHRVVNKGSKNLILCITMTCKVIWCINIAQNTQISLKIDEFAI